MLSRLAAVADRTGCTVLLLRHLNKASGRDPLYRGGGSIGIVGAARAGLLVASDPDDPERRVLASVKSNLCPAPDSLAYRLVDAGDHGVARVQWEGHTDHTAHSLLAEPRDDDKGATTEAEQWLHDYLQRKAQHHPRQGERRLYGFLHGAGPDFYALWWDPEHQIWPSTLRNT